MKKLLILCIGAFTTFHSQAQNTSGKIYYAETVKMNIHLNDDDLKNSGMTAEQFSALIPKEHTTKKVLYYNPDAALYDEVKQEASTDATSQNGNMNIVMNFAGGGDKVYRDIKNNKSIAQRDFMSRKFLVSSDIQKTDWKMTGKQKEILGFPCQEATCMKDTQKVVAWFTPAIPVSAGPMGMGGLPGMILEAEIGDNFVITAFKAEQGDVEKLLVKPTEGKKVTKEKYDEIVAAKVKEMQAENGGSGNGIIIRTEVRH